MFLQLNNIYLQGLIKKGTVIADKSNVTPIFLDSLFIHLQILIVRD